MLHAVIMAGGTGTRFWPESRRNRPKQVLPIAGSRPLIAETLLRLDGLVPTERTYIVTHESQAAPILGSLGVGQLPRVVAEPFGRDTAACIGLAALHVRRADPDGIMLIMPADQVIRPPERFREIMQVGVDLLNREDALVTFGIKPRYPATGYGYIHRGPQVASIGGVPVFRVLRFREKPAYDVAEDYLASGDYYWNSGIFCWRAATILERLRLFTPELHAALERIGGALATPNEDTVLREAYEPLEKISIDYAVMERAESIRVVEADFDWSDVGTWESVAKLRGGEADAAGNVIVGRCEALDVANSLVIGDDNHLIGVIGLENIVIVRTPDATLVCAKDRAEEVKHLVQSLEKKGLTRYL